MPVSQLRRLLLKHEGLRLRLYADSVGKLSIGVGRNIQDMGITETEAYLMLANDIGRVQQEATDRFPWFSGLSVVRQDVVLSMLFNMGMERLEGFVHLLEALRVQDYEKAAREMEASKWAGQVGLRAVELTAMMRTGNYA